VPRAFAAVLVGLALGACQRPSHEACESLCLRYSELQFWDAFEAQSRALSPADRETLRVERVAEWAEIRKQPQNRGRDNCITACRLSGTKAQIACVEKATTAAAAARCLAED
jgi:hypothetical protein